MSWFKRVDKQELIKCELYLLQCCSTKNMWKTNVVIYIVPFQPFIDWIFYMIDNGTLYNVEYSHLECLKKVDKQELIQC